MNSLERPDLAPYAAKSNLSKGRKYREEFKDDRPAFERDRDRIIHSSAFRRLEYKTQVFVNHEGDYYRTRLTHSLEVAQIAKGIARRLKLNEELTESLALAHDLGHTPFGHSGEKALNRMMEGVGGFEHNLQSLRVVEVLEDKYPGFQGLNLTWERLGKALPNIHRVVITQAMLTSKNITLRLSRLLRRRLSILLMRLHTITMT